MDLIKENRDFFAKIVHSTIWVQKMANLTSVKHKALRYYLEG